MRKREKACDIYVLAAGGRLDEQPLFSGLRCLVMADAYGRFRHCLGDTVSASATFDAAPPSETERHLEGNAGNSEDRAKREMETFNMAQRWFSEPIESSSFLFDWFTELCPSLVDAGMMFQTSTPFQWCKACRTLIPRGQKNTCQVCTNSFESMASEQWYLRLEPLVDQAADLANYVPKGKQDEFWDILGKIDGAEIEVQTLDGNTFPAFTPHPDALAEAQFIGFSPNSVTLDELITDAGVAQRLQAMRAGVEPREGGRESYPAIYDTGIWAQISGSQDLHPIVVSWAVDARYGATAALGMPSLDEIDASLVKRLPRPPGFRIRSGLREPSISSGSRFRSQVVPISTPAVRESLAEAREENRSLNQVDSDRPPIVEFYNNYEFESWMHLQAAIVSLLQRGDLKGEYGSFDQVLFAGDVELYSAVVPPEQLRAVVEQLVSAGQEDVLRFALLHAAAPPKTVGAETFFHALGQAEAFFGALVRQGQQYSGASVEISDAKTLRPLCRRLAKWGKTAQRKIVENYEARDFHKATRNLMLLHTRVQDFESRVKRNGGCSAEDRQVVAGSLLRLIDMLEPIAPCFAEKRRQDLVVQERRLAHSAG